MATPNGETRMVPTAPPSAGFAPEELVAIAIRMSDKTGGEELYTGKAALRYLFAKYGCREPADLTAAICQDINMPLEQIRANLQQDERLKERAAVVLDSTSNVRKCKEMHRRETQAFARDVEQHYESVRSDLELEKATIFNAMTVAYMRRLEASAERGHRFPRFSAEVDSDSE